MTLGILLVVLVISLSQAQKTPSISFISGPEVVTSLGSKAVLVCKVEDGKEFPINWIKISGSKKENYEYFPLSTGKTLAVRDDRFSLSSDTEKSSLSINLEIDNIKEIDDAIYQCQVIVGIGNKITKEVRLRVKTPVTIFPNSTSSLTVVEGETVSLNCNARGFPTPSIQWERKEKKLFSTGKRTYTGASVTFSSVTRGDAGEYSCTAENGVGEVQSHAASLEVRFSPSIRVVRPRVQQAPHYDVVLQCEIESYPAPAINWRREGGVLVNDDRHSVTHFSRGETSTLSTLKIFSLTTPDFGEYECEASNKHGEKTEKMELITSRIPVPQAAYGRSSLVTPLVPLLMVSTYLKSLLR